MIRINLAPPRSRRPAVSFSMPTFNLGIVFGLVYVLMLAGGGIYYSALWREESALQADVQQATRELATLKATVSQSAKVKEQLADLTKRVDAIQELTKNQPRPILMLSTFVETVADDVWITGLEEKNRTLRVSGTAFSPAAVSDFMAKLRASGKFKDVDIVQAKQESTTGPRLVTFEVTCRFEM